jgi:hypothetical protein
MGFRSHQSSRRCFASVLPSVSRFVLLNGGLVFALALGLMADCPSALAEVCRRQVVNGEVVIICCDGNGVCYRR